MCATGTTDALIDQDRPTLDEQQSQEQQAMQVHYLEIVTPDVGAAKPGPRARARKPETLRKLMAGSSYRDKADESPRGSGPAVGIIRV